MSDMNDKKNIIGKNIKRIAEDNGKNLAEFAKSLGVSRTAVSAWVSGEKIPRMDKIHKICVQYGVLQSEILEEPLQEDSFVALLAKIAKTATNDDIEFLTRYVHDQEFRKSVIYLSKISK